MNSLTGREGRERLLGVLGKLLVVDVEGESAGIYPVHLGHLCEESPVTMQAPNCQEHALVLPICLPPACFIAKKGLEMIKIFAMQNKNYSRERRPLPPYWAAFPGWAF